MDGKKVQDLVNNLAGSLHMIMNYNSHLNFQNDEKIILIVEGHTDKIFIENHLKSNIICEVANKMFRNENNYKEAIIEVVYGLSVFPQLIKCPKGFEKWKVYGLIDMDFDPSNAHTRIHNLFVTDTHDIETLVLSTDDSILQKIDKCIISCDDAKKALFVAYQLGKLRNILNNKISFKSISAGCNDIDYNSFVRNDYRISLADFFTYVNSNEKNVKKELLKEKNIIKYFSSDGCWSGLLNDFDVTKITDFWTIVNGHDILSLLKFVNEEAMTCFRNKSNYGLNREFEIAIINAYDHCKFSQTKLYSKMYSEHLVKEIN